MCTNQSCSITWDNKQSDYFKISNGVKQDCKYVSEFIVAWRKIKRQTWGLPRHGGYPDMGVTI